VREYSCRLRFVTLGESEGFSTAELNGNQSIRYQREKTKGRLTNNPLVLFLEKVIERAKAKIDARDSGQTTKKGYLLKNPC